MEKLDLKNYRELLLEVAQLRDQLMMLESSMYSPKNQRISSTPRSSSGDRSMADPVARHIKLEEFYREELAKKEAKQLAIEQAIASLVDDAERVVLRYRYIEGRSWAYICARMSEKGYSERQVYRLHGFALARLKEV